MLNNNKYINELRDKVRLNKINKMIYEYNFNTENDKKNIFLNNTNNTNNIDLIYNTDNVTINQHNYLLDCDITKYLPHRIEFDDNNNQQFFYTNNYMVNQSIDEFHLNLNYDDEPKFNKSYIIMYYINRDIIPFIMLFMTHNTINNLYTFPEINIDISNSNKLKEIYNENVNKYIKDIYNFDSTVKGIKNYNNSCYVFIEIKKLGTNHSNKGIWALSHELINDTKILNTNVSNIVTEFIIKHLEYITLNNYEKPILAYQLIRDEYEENIFYTIDNFNRMILNDIDKNEKFHRVALFIGKLKINNVNNFSDCNSIYKYNKYKDISKVFIHSNKQIVYLSTHKLNELL